MLKYREILLIRPGRIYGQRRNLMGLYSGEGGGGGEEGGGYIRQGAYIREEKHFNLQSVKLIFLSFFQYKAYTGGNIGMLIGLHMAAYIRECLLYGRGGVRITGFYGIFEQLKFEIL